MKALLKSITPLRRALLKRKRQRGIFGQSDEGQILRRLSNETKAEKTFVEFGFHPAEFNCASLIDDHMGLLIDGDARQVADARWLLPKHIRVRQRFLALENLDEIRDAFPRLGILSIDVDGNDYWFLKALIDLDPAIISVEYNASLGQRSVAVPYDPTFDRKAKHPSGWYHGASLLALHKLAADHGYGLAAVADGGGNAFFTKAGDLDPVESWRPTRLRDQWSGKSADEQWEIIADMPFVAV